MLQPVFRKEKPRPWWDGRQVAIRPDVPGSHFDPGDLVLIETDDERTEMDIRIDACVDEEAQAPSDDLWPDWLAPRGGEVHDSELEGPDLAP
jgi:hypothetical protein